MQTLTPAETRTFLENVRWETYVELAQQRSGSVPRMTYDRGELELMSPGRQHENIGCILGRILETYTEVRGIEIQSVASMTCKREDLQRGFEPDESYYIEHSDLIRPKLEVDLSIDPPPDLVIEVEITKSAIEKLQLFAAMGVPEVWRHDGGHLQMLRLEKGEYKAIESSVAAPGLSIVKIEAVLEQRFDKGENALMREFRRSLIES